MAVDMQRKNKTELVRVCTALANNNPLSCEEIHFVQMCSLILGSHSDEKVAQIRESAVDAGTGDPAKTIKTIRRLLDVLGADVEAHRTRTPGPCQITRNMDNLHRYAHPQPGTPGEHCYGTERSSQKGV
jgi:hypothetical protein